MRWKFCVMWVVFTVSYFTYVYLTHDSGAPSGLGDTITALGAIIVGMALAIGAIDEIDSAIHARYANKLANDQRTAKAREHADRKWEDEQRVLQFLASQNGVDNRGHTIIPGEVVKD